MRRHVRLPKYMRMMQAQPAPVQAVADEVRKAQERAETVAPKHWARRDIFKPLKSVVKRLFRPRGLQ